MGDVRIAWGMTAYGPIWAPAYTSHIRAVAYASREFTVQHIGKVAGAGCTDRMYTHSAENQLVKDFLDNSDADEPYTHLFLTEQDMILPKHTLPKLLEVGKPIVSGVYFLRNGNGQPCLFQKVMTPKGNPYPHSPVSLFPTEHPFRVDCPGLGCVLFERRVFEEVPFPWFDLKENAYGSDMYFYTHARQKRLECWAQPGVMCDQIDYQLVGYEDYKRRLRDDPKFAASGFILGDTAPLEHRLRDDRQ